MSVVSNSDSIATSTSLLERAKTGESIAWQRIIQLYGPLVYSWCRRYGLPACDAADVTQETFAAITQQLNRFDQSRTSSNFRGWLRMICRNKAMDFFRERKRSIDGVLGAGGTANLEILNSLAADQSKALESSTASSFEADDQLVFVAGQTEKDEQRQIIHRALEAVRGTFERQTWLAFWRTTVDGVEPGEVASELGVSRWAVYKARSRVLHRLRTELYGLEDF